MKNNLNLNILRGVLFSIFAYILATGFGLPEAHADAAADERKAAEEAFTNKSDKTGTNPINFQHDFRVYHEYQDLDAPGNADQHITTLEFRAPIDDGKWQFRMRARAQSLDVGPLQDDGVGDFDFRFLTVPYFNLKKKVAFAYALEVFLPTATEDSLGTGAVSLGPQAFGAVFAPFGMKSISFFPGYQHKFSIDKEDDRERIHQSVIDLFVLWTSPKKQFWALLDPQIIIDYKTNEEFMILDLEMGTMLERFIGLKGHSAYIRPALGVGADSPVDASYEAGYKILW